MDRTLTVTDEELVLLIQCVYAEIMKLALVVSRDPDTRLSILLQRMVAESNRCIYG